VQLSRVYYTLTLTDAVIRGHTLDKLVIRWDEPHIPRGPLAIPLAWTATREYILTHIPDLTDVAEANLEIAFP
jgi:hypothetical protein